MKHLLFWAAPLAVLTSCTSATQPQVQSIVEQKLAAQTQAPASYQPISTKVIERPAAYADKSPEGTWVLHHYKFVTSHNVPGERTDTILVKSSDSILFAAQVRELK